MLNLTNAVLNLMFLKCFSIEKSLAVWVSIIAEWYILNTSSLFGTLTRVLMIHLLYHSVVSNTHLESGFLHYVSYHFKNL